MNRLLIDTCVLIDILLYPEKLSEKALSYINNSNYEMVISSISLWEIEIKHHKHPDIIPIDSYIVKDTLQNDGVDMVPLKEVYVIAMPAILEKGIHNDPFDHMLLATSEVEGWILLTKDKVLAEYGIGNVVLV